MSETISEIKISLDLNLLTTFTASMIIKPSGGDIDASTDDAKGRNRAVSFLCIQTDLQGRPIHNDDTMDSKKSFIDAI